MKNIILKYGFLGGIVASIFMISLTFYMKSNPNEEPSMVFGFLTMIAAYAIMIFGMFQLRQNNSTISFNQTFLSGALICFITSTIYVLLWLVIYYNFFPNFMDVYGEMMLKNVPVEELAAKKIEVAQFKEIYKSPLGIIGMTYMEIFPIGIVVAFVSAIILKKK